MFEKILIANRGEIACRVIHTAKKMGIRCVAIYSDADQHALHVRLADEAYSIGASSPSESYLQKSKIIAIAQQCGAQAIHPGYGFLAENAEFAAACEQANIYFIGPPAAAIRAMGAKNAAKEIMQKAGVPILEGYHGKDQSLATLSAAAKKAGFPILIKPVAGGGGKGMRIVAQESEFAAAYTAAKNEAKSSFGDDALLIEKYLSHPRHIEIQIFADTKGNCVSLFERDCSTQRRYQKIIEEAPAPKFTKQLRQAMSAVAITAARAINYVGAGTIEFLVDEQGAFYFMEMNTRLQVEHPVTEKITGLDLVEWQLRVAAGEPLPLEQKQIVCTGHAFEARICAEDPNNHFLPAIGQLHYMHLPQQDQHVRIDTGVHQGDHISIYYDSLIAKLIVWDKSRAEALKRLQQALADFHVVGVTTNIEFLQAIVSNSHFAAGEVETGFIPRYQDTLFNRSITITEQTLAIASLYLLLQQQWQAQQAAMLSEEAHSPWHESNNWRLNLPQQQFLRFRDKQQEYIITITTENNHFRFDYHKSSCVISGEFFNQQTEDNQNGNAFLRQRGIAPTDCNSAEKPIIKNITASINDNALQATVVCWRNQLHIFTHGLHQQLELCNSDFDQLESDELSGHLNAPMPGTVVAIQVKTGTVVDRGVGLLVIEAMKMEHTIYAPSRGIVTAYHYGVGDRVDEGTQLLDFTVET